MTTTQSSQPLRAIGFVEGYTGPQKDHPISDGPISGLVYLYRKHGNQHQYVSLCGTDQAFMEATIFVYAQPLSRKRERPLFLGIRRTIEDVIAAVEVAYPPLKD